VNVIKAGRALEVGDVSTATYVKPVHKVTSVVQSENVNV